jgi:hypothetical protein
VAEPNRYSQLIDGICEICKVTPDESMYTRFEFTVRNAPITLIPAQDSDGHPGGVGYFADVGPLPQQRREAVAIELLETNLFMVGRDAPFYCLNPESGHVMVAGVMALERLTPVAALESLTVLAASISEVRPSLLSEPAPRCGATASRLAALAPSRSP